MAFSNRDKSSPLTLLRSQSGQGIIEYILVMVVTVALILGALYQLNTAFKSWAANYFGEYIACLLETGELPAMGGGAGNGVCNEIFKPFTLTEGRPSTGLSTGQNAVDATTKPPGRGGGGGPGGGEREAGGARRAAGGRGGGGSSGSNFNPNFGRKGTSGANGSGAEGKDGEVGTGNTNTTNYGASGDFGRRNGVKNKEHLDTRFAFEREEEERQKRKPALASNSKKGEEAANSSTRIRRLDRKKDAGLDDDGGMTFGNFLRWLIIAAIIIALVLLVGGQMLQVGKSME